ncbi:MAG: hypothetical protein LBJ92_04345 [Holosporales bacterium]|nr:hypothetical protein [Holosporales bacterium]
MQKCLLFFLCLDISAGYAGTNLVNQVTYDARYVVIGAGLGAGLTGAGMIVARNAYAKDQTTSGFGHAVYGACIGGGLAIAAEWFRNDAEPGYLSSLMSGVNAGFICGGKSSETGQFLGRLSENGISCRTSAGLASVALTLAIGAAWGGETLGKRTIHPPETKQK